MAFIKSYSLPGSAILRINSEKDNIWIDPPYQRNSDIWSKEKRQLLIDSILNEYDIPKLYFHILPEVVKEKKKKEYAIIDGRQRLESIWSFISGDFSLSEDFVYQRDSSIKAKGFSYNDIATHYPRLKILFDSFTLPITAIETEDYDLIEDMFSRLNEAVPLNAAEKRNAFGGPLPRIIEKLSLRPLFKEKVNFSNKRYQYREVVTRLIWIEYCQETFKKIYDTKKIFLDQLVKDYKQEFSSGFKRISSKELDNRVNIVLSKMHSIFTKKDKLLTSQSIIPIYYLLFQDYTKSNEISKITRNKLNAFRNAVDNNRKIAEQDITKANYDFLEFDKLSQQGTNDASSIRERFRILKDYLEKTKFVSLSSKRIVRSK